MNRLAHLITRIADAHMNMMMDQLMRVGLLEGIAGVQVGAWKKLHPPARGLQKAEDFFTQKGNTLDPRWFDLHDQGMFKAVYFQALQITKNKEEAENIAQDIVSGFSRSEDTEGGQLYDLGKKKLRDDPSFDHAKGMMKNHARHRAIPAITRNRSESLTMDTEDGDAVRDIPNTTNPDTITDNLISFLSDPKGGALFEIIRKVLGREWAAAPSKLAILDAVVADPSRSDVGIARDLGHGENDEVPWIMLGAATYVSKTRREIKKRIPEIVAKTPGLLAHLELQQELAPLGYGQQRWARQAKNLATFLKTPIP
jgi:hypothetical protein